MTISLILLHRQTDTNGLIKGPTITPQLNQHHTDSEPDNDPSLNNLHQGPLYPTVDGKPPKLPAQQHNNKENIFNKKPKPQMSVVFRPPILHIGGGDVGENSTHDDQDNADDDDEDDDDTDGNNDDDVDINDHDGHLGNPQLHPQQHHHHSHHPSSQQHDGTQQSSPPHNNHHSNKFDFTNYDEDEDITGAGPPSGAHPNTAHGAVGPGPGFFNPAASKTQYNDFDAYGHNLNIASPSSAGKPFHPFQPRPQQANGSGGNGGGHQTMNDVNKIPPELFNIPNVRIEQLLQHYQGGGAAGLDSASMGHLPPPFGGGAQVNGINGGYTFTELAGGGEGGVRPLPPGFNHFHSGCFMFGSVGSVLV